MRKYTLYFIVIVAVICGCAYTASAPPPDPVTQATVGVAGIVAHTESAERHVQSALPQANPTGKVYLTAASDEHKAVLANAAQTNQALAGARQEAARLQDELAEQQSNYVQLENQWYVRWGRRIERALWVIGIGWLVLGITSMVLGLGNPLTWTWRIGKEITRLVPAMNPFSWIRDWLLARKIARSKA